MTPPTSRSSTITNLPCSLTTREPLRHFVTNSELPGTWPERRDGEQRREPERAGGRAEHPEEEAAPCERVRRSSPSVPRRAGRSRARSPRCLRVLDSSGSRSSVNGPWGRSWRAITTNAKPSPPSANASRTPSSWVSPPSAYSTASPSADDGRHRERDRDLARGALFSVGAHGAPRCDGRRTAGAGSRAGARPCLP